MSNSTFLYEFDIQAGPILLDSIKRYEFTPEQLCTLGQNAFPESAITTKEQSLFYTFTIPNSPFFCFSIYVINVNPKFPRGHKLFTYIVVTDLPYYTPMHHLLMSSLALYEEKSFEDLEATRKEILMLIDNFLQKWINQLSSSTDKRIDLPTFISSIPVAEVTKVTDFFEEKSVYFLNKNFLDIDLCSTLDIHNSMKNGKTMDILKLWEISLLNENLIVYGSNASYASSAVLAISSLSYPITNKERIIPFISFTDTRLKAENIDSFQTNSIVGISHPLIIDRLKYDNVYKIGFGDPNDNGLLNFPPRKWDFLIAQDNITSKGIRKYLYENTMKVLKTIQKVFFYMCQTNPYEAASANLNPDLLLENLYEIGVDIVDSYEIFTHKLIRTRFIRNVCDKLCKDKSMENYLKMFPVSQICNCYQETQKIDLYEKINQFKKKCHQTDSIIKLIEQHLLAVKLSISPNLAFTGNLEP